MRPCMAKSPSEVERRAIIAGFEILMSDEKSEEKGKFKGYSRSNISDRPIRQAKNKTWTVSRKNKRGKTARRYQRNKTRGNVRPAMRRQLGAGGKRASTKR